MTDKVDRVNGIPVRLLVPQPKERSGHLAIWIPRFGGDKNETAEALTTLAQAGHVAVGIDPALHGERATQSPFGLFKKVFGNFRGHMWPLMGRTALDALHVVDWAVARYKLDQSVLAGGVSMGGDIALSLAVVDRRVSHVAGIAMSADWCRPEMTEIDKPGKLLDQGTPTSEGELLCRLFNPSVNTDRLDRDLAIRFELGGRDTHIRVSSANVFRDALAGNEPGRGVNIEIVVHEKSNHAETVFSAEINRATAEWLANAVN
jgi:dienelactone hydrolase